MDDFSLGDRELDVMAVLWKMESGTVGEVRERLPVNLAYTTVLTILRNLEAKGYLSHSVEGRAHRFAPLVAQRTAQRSALHRMLAGFFGGSPEALLARLVDDHGLDAAELRVMAERIATHTSRKRRPR